MAKIKNRAYHAKRAKIGGAIALSGIGGPIGVPYAGYHLYKMGQHAPPKPNTHSSVKHQGRVGKKPSGKS